MDGSKQQEIQERAPKRHRSIITTRVGDDGDAVDQHGRSDIGDDGGRPSIAATAPQRIIIALDLDAFYVAASRVRDPSLNGLPIGIKQKGILATASYEARARGVQKLATVKDAMAKCPELVLVNGEDLSFFRKLSNQIWRLVRSLVWGQKVEKLGLDELFCDVTDMVAFNIAQEQEQQRQPGPSSHRRAFFRLDGHDPQVGFEYDADATLGHSISADGCSRSENPTARAFFLASHLAAHLRGLILHHVGLTASAGIAHSKLLAKLACAVHKPAAQTTFAPTSQADVAAFLDPYEVRSLNGFGGSIVNKLRTSLGGEALGHSGTEWLNGGLGPDPQAKLQEERAGAPPVALTVALCRKAFSAQSFSDMFGERLGKRLWGLLNGRDDEDVVPAPPFPTQISIEDTYRGLRGPAVQEQLHVLSLSLLRRLEAELVDVEEEDKSPSLSSAAATPTMYAAIHEPIRLPADEAVGSEPHISLRGATVRSYVERPASEGPASGQQQCNTPGISSAQAPPRTWKRYPLSVRLSLRQGWNNRISKQTRMPVEIFDLSLSMQDRAAALVTTLNGIYRAMTHGSGHASASTSADGTSTSGLNLLNVAALDLDRRRPDTALGRFFEREQGAPRPKKRPAEDLDLEVLKNLPPDLRREVALQYGLTEGQLMMTERAGEARAAPEPHALTSPPASSPPTLTDLVCERCGAFQEAWLQHDHTIWPIRGLPPSLAEAKASARDGATSRLSESESPVPEEMGSERAVTDELPPDCG